ncbi:GTP cyclohydrolase, FolE2/MptA family [Desulfogranum mediterraneum]|uniref:GTP cyclohydrolase, FolE2/MptA family n=1 Tax=Desulfogranum mediterraneum TaxID=160661 RepID=UPI00040F2FC3|nr:GTP cyclohydrolase, FolE2/MptA family [Desulfogranum mediterraneum]
MKDIQSLHDSRRIDIRKVGVKNISYPITVLDRARKTQQTVASVNMYVNLPHQFKGTHMSRFVEILNRFHGRFNLETLHLILEEMKQRLDAEAAHLEIAFPYFFSSDSGKDSFCSQRYDCRMSGSLQQQLDLVVEVEIPVPLGVSDPLQAGVIQAEGVWGTVRVSVRLNHFLWMEELITLIEDGIAPVAGSGSASRVEELCLQIDATLGSDDAFSWYKVVVENITSGYSISASVEGP